MKKIGFIGLGKLGLPVAIAVSSKFEVMGYDVNPALMKKRTYEHKEEGLWGKSFQELFDESNITFNSLEEICKECSIIFVAVQTPHLPAYEGITRMPEERADFNYTYLINCVKELSKFVNPENVVTIVSTVLPGTLREHILPILKDKCAVVYNPSFIAMGTVIKDYMNPEFILLGSDHKLNLDFLSFFYHLLLVKPTIIPMSIESAELTKVAYNAFISLKIVYANTLMEICQKIDRCNVDDVTHALGKATDRLISTKYLTAGMGDGGGCHPRDNIAMSWLAQKLNLSYDIFEANIKARELQANYLVMLMIENGPVNLPKIILGSSFKPETNIETGSPAVLCSNLLLEKGLKFTMFDPYINSIEYFKLIPAVYLVGTKHNFFKGLIFPKGSVVIDPHRYIADQEGVEVIRVGE